MPRDWVRRSLYSGSRRVVPSTVAGFARSCARAGRPAGFAPGLRIPAAVELPLAAGLGVPGALGGAALLAASGAEPAAGLRRTDATLRAGPPRDPLGGELTGALALAGPVAEAWDTGRTPAGVAGAVPGPVFLGAHAAQGKAVLGFTDTAARTKTCCPALFGPFAEPLAVRGAAASGITIGHALLQVGTGRRTPGRRRAGGTSWGRRGCAPISPSGGGPQKLRGFSSPSTGSASGAA